MGPVFHGPEGTTPEDSLLVLTVQLNPYATTSIASAAATSLGCARAVPTSSAVYTATNNSGTHGKPGTLNGAGPSRARSRNSAITAHESITRTWTMARPSSSSNVPVAASAMAKTPMTSIATHGVPPAFTRPSAAGARPSRASPNSTRGVTNTLPFKDASTTSSASPATTTPPRAPTSAAITSAATRFDAAIRSSGST